jgi:hypothetical protein
MPEPSFEPRTLKGALIAVDPDKPTTALTSIVFQYNPEAVTRKLSPRIEAEGLGGRATTYRYAGAPQETFDLTVEFDALGWRPKAEKLPATGIYPQLSALETLLYPKSEEVRNNDKLLAQGTMEVGGGLFQAPLLLLVWGEKRVVPVKLTSMTVRETYYDADLYPIMAKVDLGLEVLSYSELQPSHPGYNRFLTYQSVKEGLAKEGSSPNAKALTGFDISAA